ncbi:MAG: WxcM-like domain-containing protein [Blastocatellia bacterium]|jgi:acetyltransferase-like isoleucine patch superfamily enzyme
MDKAWTHSLIDPEARVADTAILGDFVIVSKGAFIGDGVRIHGFTQIWEDVRIESNVILESGVVLQRPLSADGKATIFRPGCVIGAGAVIRHGVTIGEGAIIRPGSVVEHDIPPYAIVSGFPARAVGYVESISSEVRSAWRLQATFPSTPATVPLGVGAVTLHRLKKVCDPRGDLSVGEFPLDIPFEPKRYFLVFNVPSENTRGEHAHRKCHQFLICVNGSCALVVDDGKSRCEILLESRDMGVHLPPMTWGIQYKHSKDAVLLVFTSEYYDADDYIRDYGDFIALTAGER